MDQLFILDKVPKEKLLPDKNAVEEVHRLDSVSINQSENRTRSRTIITSLNIRSLSCHITDLKNDHKIMASPVIALQESWDDNPDRPHQHLQIPGYILHLTSVPVRSKGLATYYHEDQINFASECKNERFQMAKFIWQTTAIINIYRLIYHNSLISSV